MPAAAVTQPHSLSGRQWTLKTFANFNFSPPPLTRSFLFPTACRYYRTDGAAFKKMGAVKAATLQMMLETGYDVFIRCARYLSERRMQAETKHVAPLL